MCVCVYVRACVRVRARVCVCMCMSVYLGYLKDSQALQFVCILSSSSSLLSAFIDGLVQLIQAKLRLGEEKKQEVLKRIEAELR